MAQNESAYVAGKTTEKGLIAIIRFSTDKWNIDDAGLAVLRNLTSNFRILLDTYRVSFTCVGFADQRAGFWYNLDLGLKRAVEVKQQIDRAFYYLPNYTGIATYSLGETQANQRATKPADLALDRQVKVYSTWAAVIVPVVAIPEAAPTFVLRTTRRSFSQSTYENSARPDMSDWKPAIKSGIAIVRGEQKTFENVWGPEDMSSRVTAKTDASYRVNKVIQKFSYSYDAGLSVFVQRWSAEINYEWGIPKDYVRVEIHNDLAGGKTYDAKYVLRSKADASVMLTPPDPK
jgi:hypothetical protein